MLKCVFTEHSLIKDMSVPVFKHSPYSFLYIHVMLSFVFFFNDHLFSLRLLYLLTIMVWIPQGPGLI